MVWSETLLVEGMEWSSIKRGYTANLPLAEDLMQKSFSRRYGSKFSWRRVCSGVPLAGGRDRSSLGGKYTAEFPEQRLYSGVQLVEGMNFGRGTLLEWYAPLAEGIQRNTLSRVYGVEFH